MQGNQKLPNATNSQVRVFVQVLWVRLRFFALIGGLAAIAIGWPWLQIGWSRLLEYFPTRMSESSVASDREYFCPMDPGVVSLWPSICPVCNMDLIARKKSDAVLLPSGVLDRMQLSPYRIALAGIRTMPVEEMVDEGSQLKWKCVPRTSIVYRSNQSIVYVESMPGMLDAIPVKVIHDDDGKQGEDDKVRVEAAGLEVGKRVVAIGTLLVDAESRLNPNLSTQYFGASNQLAGAQAPAIHRKSSHEEAKHILTEEEQRIVDMQKFCPVTGAPLGSMGTPPFVQLGERRVAICCEGCRKRLEQSPEQYLSWLDQAGQNDQKDE